MNSPWQSHRIRALLRAGQGALTVQVSPINVSRTGEQTVFMAKAIQKKPVRRMGRPTAEESRIRDEKLKSAAYKLFLDNGFDAVTMEAIAAAAGITKRTLYAKYRDKGELFSVVLRELQYKWPIKAINIAASKEAPLVDQLSAAADALLAQVLDHETVKLARMASAKAEQFSEDIQQGFTMSRDPRLHSIVRILRRHEKEIDGKFLEEEEKTAELFIGLIIGIPARLAGFGTIRDPDFEKERIKLAVEIFVAGIRKQ